MWFDPLTCAPNEEERLVKYIVIAIMLMIPSAAMADGFKIVTQSRIEYKHTYSAEDKHYVQPDLNFRLENNLGEEFNKFETALWIVPRLRFGFGSWKLGPEFRVPVIGTKVWKLLLQAELDIDKWDTSD